MRAKQNSTTGPYHNSIMHRSEKKSQSMFNSDRCRKQSSSAEITIQLVDNYLPCGKINGRILIIQNLHARWHAVPRANCHVSVMPGSDGAERNTMERIVQD